MKRYILSWMLASLMMWPCGASAKAYRSIQVIKKDGTSLLIKGEQGITMTVTDEEMKFFTTPDNHFSLSVDEVKEVTLSEEEGKVVLADVDEISSGSIILSRSGETLAIENIPSGSRISVVSAAGMVLHNAIAEGDYVVNLSSFPTGVYVVVINNRTFKISVAR